MPQRFVTNNVDPSFRANYRDGNIPGLSPCTGDDQLYGASGPQGNTILENTDEAGRNQWGGGLFKYLFYERSIYFEAPGEADGPKRFAEEQNPLQLALRPAGLGPRARGQASGWELRPHPRGPRRRRAGDLQLDLDEPWVGDLQLRVGPERQR